ncbi:MAG: UDP-N-acetylmuramoyl-L-alanyl-D-glutamate--2,6-diaminopimelate ligase [Clostridia bacterium]
MQKHIVAEYIKSLKNVNELKNIIDCNEVLEKEVEYMSYDSRDIENNTLFICKGNDFKKEYLESAVKNGVFIYVSQIDYEVGIPCILVNNIRVAHNDLAKMYYNNPSEKLNVIGITGTKGKSTTAYYIRYILDEYAKANLKNKTAIISSIDTYDGVEEFESHITTPEALELQRHFYNAKESKIENVVMEASSQSLKYNRLDTVNFAIGVFLNISIDHISPIEHEDFEDYFASKLKIFKQTKVACVNLDADFADRILLKAKEDSKKVITFSVKDKQADIYAYNVHKDGFNTVFNVKTPNYSKEFVLTMPGLFNVENALAAIAVSFVLSIPEKYIYAALKIARSSGRMEVYHTKDEKIVAIVDYAHNKLSFEKLFESSKLEYPGRKIVAIFGSAGKKAYIRREHLGTVAGMNADKIFLVAEDPGFEPVEQISNDIALFIKKYMQNYELIEDRGEAIKKAIEEATSTNVKTVILITGKGNETRQKYGDKYLPCTSDVEYVKMYLKEYDKIKRMV